MSVKIVFSDIDGTFLTNDHNVTDETEYAVNQLLNQNIPFVLVSARMPEAIYPITEKLGIKIPIICYSGGLVLTESEDGLYSRTIDREIAARLIDTIDERWANVTVNYYTGRRWFVRDVNDKRVKREENITNATAYNGDFYELLEIGMLPNKLLMMSEPDDCKQMERELGAMFPELNVVRSSDILLEIMDKNVSKATGIKVMLEHFDFAPEDAIGFGDNYNDVDMFRYVGRGVAMNNAPEPIKEMVHDVTDSNNDSGIYSYLVKEGIINAHQFDA